jgi:hypothetical protein
LSEKNAWLFSSLCSVTPEHYVSNITYLFIVPNTRSHDVQNDAIARSTKSAYIFVHYHTFRPVNYAGPALYYQLWPSLAATFKWSNERAFEHCHIKRFQHNYYNSKIF